jgi:hypothetical protein
MPYKCVYEGCDTRPIYNEKGKKGGLYCVEHKEKGMVDVVNKTCAYEGCYTRPIYNERGKKCGLYCVEHKEEGMVNVKDKTCAYEGCDTRPYYNERGKKCGVYCFEHKKDGMVDVKNKKCAYEGCDKQPIYNERGKKCGVYCFEHKEEGMVNVKDKTCAYEWCGTRVGNKYKGYCLRCYMYTFPNEPVSRNYKTKERAVVEYITENFPDLTWVNDKRIYGGCSGKRPDLLADLGYQVLILEIDEEQHSGYETTCENKRIMQLSVDVQHRPIVFVRFNPDSYIDNHGKKVTSCWSVNKNGICVIKKTKNNEWRYRLEELSKHVKHWTTPENRSCKMVHTVQLFYTDVSTRDHSQSRGSDGFCSTSV